MEGPLSTDVVMGIVMSNLKVRDLLNCRKVSKFWNKMASSALRKRSTMIKNISSEAELMELGECMRDSSNFPFVGLKLFRKPCRLSSAGANEFFRNHGASFRRLYLGPWSKTRLEDLAQLMNYLPRLSTLEVSSSWELTPDAGLLKHPARQEDGSVLNLPSLRTVRIYSETNQGFLRQICTAASPSLQIECLNATYRTLKALERVGKLQAVSVMNTYKDKDHASSVARLLSTVSPTLTKLDLSINSCLSLDGLKQILISSQHTLKELRLVGIYPSQFLSECPVLAKLAMLNLCISNRSYEHVFQGNQGNKFPALKELKLETTYREYDPANANFSDGLFIVPSLTTIDLNGRVDINGFKDLAQSFPNVIQIRLKHRYYDDEPNEIWNLGAFMFLEKLIIWDYPIRRPTMNNCTMNRGSYIMVRRIGRQPNTIRNYMNMDGFLTGMCSAICKKLRKHAQQNLMDSPFNEILRKNPSILQLKNLKELVVCVYLDFEDDGSELPEEPPLISMVSVWYALQMMPNMQARFVYEPSSLLGDFGEEERDKAVAVLKAAFKHVQPYVKLEPYFY